MFTLDQTDHSWTLFLDRDGVLNHDKDNDYIRNWDEFKFYDGVLAALSRLASQFHRIVIVTNQKGVGKKLMTPEDLELIHSNMLAAITAAGGRIDKVYFCTDLSDDSLNRKPNPGMAFQAQYEFPDIDLAKSLIVGNRLSDMLFGRHAGMHTVFLATTHPEVPDPHELVDLRYSNLPAFASHWEN